MATYGGGLVVSTAVNQELSQPSALTYTVPANSMFVGRVRVTNAGDVLVSSQTIFSGLGTGASTDQFVAGPGSVIGITHVGGSATGRLIGVILSNIS